MEGAAVHFIGARLGDDVDHAARGAPKLGAGAAGHHLEFLDGIERDVDGGALPAELFTEEAVVVVAAVQADVVEDAALPVEVDFVAIGALHDADPGRQGQQIFKLPAQNGSRSHR